MVFDPPPSGDPPTREQLARTCAHRLGRAAALSTTPLARRTPAGYQWPAWEDDPDFDLSRHIAHAALPAPGGERGAGRVGLAVLLPAPRPPPAAVGDGPARGPRRRALGARTKTHHCMVDGVGSVDVGQLLLDARSGRRRGARPATAGDADADAAAEPRVAPPGARITRPSAPLAPRWRASGRARSRRSARPRSARAWASTARCIRARRSQRACGRRDDRARGAARRAAHEPQRADRDAPALRGRARAAG